MEIRDGLVYKRGEPDVLEMEAIKTELADKIGARSGLFSVPRLVSYDPGKRTIVTEFVPGLQDLREAGKSREASQRELFSNAGRALATVHQELRLPSEHRICLPDYLMAEEGDNVVLHGDFFWGNVCCLPAARQIVILDWATAPLLGGIASYGSRYFDLLWFSWSLFFWTPPRRILDWNPEGLVRTLVAGYVEAGGRFDWRSYVGYRARMRPLVMRYWRLKREFLPAGPHHSFAELLGSIRWFLFPDFSGFRLLASAGRTAQSG